jgi:5S rRNA maturation endonuclease (ribonuclease M5)
MVEQNYKGKQSSLNSKKNRLLKKYASVILTKDPDNIGNALRKDWKKFVYLTSPDFSDSENYTKVCQ